MGVLIYSSRTIIPPEPPTERFRFRLEDIDFRNPAEIARRVVLLHKEAFPDAPCDYIIPRFEAVTDMFEGNYTGFQPMDTAYHDLEHTLQTTFCLALILINRHHTMTAPVIGPEDFNTALIAILLHDMGYLKESGDTNGTGAKYTHIHEQRSCRHARAYLERRDWPGHAIRSVENLICCTGPRARLDTIDFTSETEKMLGQAVCTADFMGQISDPRYPEKLRTLYQEFIESYTHQGLPPDQWPYHAYEDLLRKTPDFYEKFVIPRMNNECGQLWRFLEDPRTGDNPHLDSTRRNMQRIRQAIRELDSSRPESAQD
ncbi:hypothetical protein H5P28_02865 [Ruficoccus amylovorans]|uniref:HD/PDEase domain-containing protein n=1 Tax=Ruficoccus amylovorans TaxID=1804625 RepID=A0A842HCB3_9BACT|nr:hypothetical protein [Ruficoccus amylovorans]MBC2593194.1 hypothetical protein [Ruficoccus amylovorans]